MPLQYPLSAVVPSTTGTGDDMTLALVLTTISPEVGGVLVRGEKGTAKSTTVRALASVLLTALYGHFTWRNLYEALLKTLKITAMIMTVLLAGTLFTGVFIGGGGINTANTLIQEMKLSPWMLLSLMMFIIFLAGFFLDWISIVLIFIPIFTPLIKAAGRTGWRCRESPARACPSAPIAYRRQDDCARSRQPPRPSAHGLVSRR